ncbi:Gfo/Idh/MocA family oxidoreductase [Streptomyces sp. NBC_01764]|uniref:Gfo/Idh/MocA family protein n=1 Tax=Streptomyces sp. NBC_01764 TaxID=2975935 RepID=UPI00225BF735|nr:Gfo/Idh/MocA family oxidoreductase [Streptomyces sp. NBC_01764]MCX4404323.1 Gfo/Idh/MocA family oxidoreductase [Streptomyces sp. NBC_01764]
MPSHTPRSGIIGTGFMGEVHARAVRAAGGTVTAVAASTPQASEQAIPRLHVGRAATAEEITEADDVDVVHICTPNHLHVPLALRALAAGKHVVCEKPLATDLAAAQKLHDAAQAAQVVTAVPFVYRFYPTVRDAHERIRRGDAGSLRLLHGSYLQDWLADSTATNWRVDPRLGGASRAFGDIGVHWCDLVEFVSGHRITRLSARTGIAHTGRRTPSGNSEYTGTEDMAAVHFETDRGALGSAVISQVTHGRKNRLWFSLDGDLASLSFDQELPDTLWIGGPDHTQVVSSGSPEAAPGSAPYRIVPAGHPQGYQDCFTAFVRDTYAAMEGEQPDGLPTFTDGLRAAALTEAVLASAASRAWVDVPLLCEAAA